MNKKLSWVILFFLLSPLLSGVFISSTIATDPKVILVEDLQTLALYGFKDYTRVYSNQSLIHHYMPFIVEKTGVFNSLAKYDLSGSFTNKKGAFDKRFISSDFRIVDETEGYYLIEFYMKTKASNETFSVDFIPKIKDVEFPQYAWWNSSWASYVRVNINWNTFGNVSDTNLINITLPIRINSTVSQYADNGNSIRFTNVANNTLYPFHISNFDLSGGSIAWVLIPELDMSATTRLNMYFNNSGATNFSNMTDSWNDNVTFVYHLEQDPNNAGLGGITDYSGPTWHNGTDYFGDAADHVSGIVGHAENFDMVTGGVSAEWINITDNDEFSPNGGMSILLWLNPFIYSSDASQFIIAKESNPAGRDWSINLDGTNSHLDFVIGSGGNYIGMRNETADWLNQTWTQLAFTWNGSILNTVNGSGMHIYYNYTDSDNTSLLPGGFAGMPNTASNVSIATDLWTPNLKQYGIDAIFDEIQFYNCEINQSWIKATFHGMNNSTGFITFGGWVNYSGTTSPPGNFTVNTTGYYSLDLNWTVDATHDYTHIRRDTTSYPTNISEGTLVYNSTGIAFEDINVSAWTTYFYTGFGYNSTTGNYSWATSTAWNHTGPLNPTSITTSSIGSYINFTFTKGLRGNNTVIIRKNGSYPTSLTDGVVAYNGTASYFNTTLFTASRFRFYSYNHTVGLYSNGTNVAWGGLIVYCYDEETNASLTFNVFITNQGGTETYEDTGCTNPHIINLADLPLGENVIIQINSSYHNGRVYYMDLYAENVYILFAYLPNATNSNLYYLAVLDEYNFPIDDAKVYVKQYINATYGYQNVSILKTDAAGYVNLFLIPNIVYIVVITHDDYITETSQYIPDGINYGIHYPKIFKLYHGVDNDTLWANLTYSIEPQYYDFYDNFTMWFNISSVTNQIEWFSITVYYRNFSTTTWYQTYYENTTTQPAGGSLSNTTINGSGQYAFECRFKKEGFDSYLFGSPHSTNKYVFSLWLGLPSGNGSTLNTFIANILGISPAHVGAVAITYTSLGIAFIVIVVLFTFSPLYGGLGLAALGFVLGFLKGIMRLIPDNVMNWSVIAIVLLLGIILFILLRKET